MALIVYCHERRVLADKPKLRPELSDSRLRGAEIICELAIGQLLNDTPCGQCMDNMWLLLVVIVRQLYDGKVKLERGCSPIPLRLQHDSLGSFEFRGRPFGLAGMRGPDKGKDNESIAGVQSIDLLRCLSESKRLSSRAPVDGYVFQDIRPARSDELRALSDDALRGRSHKANAVSSARDTLAHGGGCRSSNAEREHAQGRLVLRLADCL